MERTPSRQHHVACDGFLCLSWSACHLDARGKGFLSRATGPEGRGGAQTPSQTVPLLQTPHVQCITVWFISGEIHAFIIKYSQTSVEVRFPSVSFWVSLVALDAAAVSVGAFVGFLAVGDSRRWGFEFEAEVLILATFFLKLVAQMLFVI